MVTQSWESNEVLERLAEIKRNGEIIKGAIQSSRKMKLPKQQPDGSIVSVEQDTFIVHLPGDVRGYCPASEFRERDFHSHVQFISQIESFVITELNLESKVALLSANKAAKQKSLLFWEEIKTAETAGRLQELVFEGVITGTKADKIYVRVNGQDCFMYNNDWSWTRRGAVDAYQGEKIQVKVLRFDPDKGEAGVVHVSRKHTLPNPWVKFSEEFKVGDLLAGQISALDSINGIFVTLSEGLEVKGSMKRALEAPAVGDFVSCVLVNIDPVKEKGRVVIVGYPRGKRKTKDLASFLFE